MVVPFTTRHASGDDFVTLIVPSTVLAEAAVGAAIGKVCYEGSRLCAQAAARVAPRPKR